MVNSENDLKKLRKNLKTIHEMAKHTKSKKRSSENELKLSIDFLKLQVTEKSSILSTFDPSELLVAKEISEVIKSNMPSFNNTSRTINKKIEVAEEKANEIENNIHELKINYEMKKSLIFQVFRKKRDDLLVFHKQANSNHRLRFHHLNLSKKWVFLKYL